MILMRVRSGNYSQVKHEANNYRDDQLHLVLSDFVCCQSVYRYSKRLLVTDSALFLLEAFLYTRIFIESRMYQSVKVKDGSADDENIFGNVYTHAWEHEG